VSERNELVEFLVGLGATPRDLEEWKDELPALASVLALRPGAERLTNEEVAAGAGITVAELDRFRRAAGLPEEAPDSDTGTRADIEAFSLIAAAGVLLGEQAVLQLTRVIGSSMARIADAAVSAFLVNVELPLRGEDDVAIALAVAKANAQAGALIPGLMSSMDLLLRRHILAARRSLLAVQSTSGYETQRLAVGFVDLVGSSALGINELGAALTVFEERASDIIVVGGGRLVKLIGDAVLFTAPQPEPACAIAGDLVQAFADHPVVPPVRGGLAFGDVLTAGGDCFGPVVNLAARIVKHAAPSAVVVTDEVRAALGAACQTTSVGKRELAGFAEPVELWEVKAPAQAG
jgi:adenylate cyclase